ncbi:hypothetical protein ACFQ3B_16810 [Stackebrandtia endophytica]|uniref:hypothetical protein n=1 Tax=Stackebrandtia endophytica TaxID=1496996 RepID=UPI001151CCA9|nr:hypothetical protein [Stackebrandtia endophytica]
MSDRYDFTGLSAEDIGAMVDAAHAEIPDLEAKAAAWRDLKKLMSAEATYFSEFIGNLKGDWKSDAATRHQAGAEAVLPQMDAMDAIAEHYATGIDRTVAKISTAKDRLDEIRRGKAEALNLLAQDPGAFDGYDPADPNGRPSRTDIVDLHDDQARVVMGDADREVHQAWRQHLDTEPVTYRGLTSDEVVPPAVPLIDSQGPGAPRPGQATTTPTGSGATVGSPYGGTPPSGTSSAPALQSVAAPPAPAVGTAPTPTYTGGTPTSPAMPPPSIPPTGYRPVTPTVNPPQQTMRPATGPTARPTPGLRPSPGWRPGTGGNPMPRSIAQTPSRPGVSRPVVPHGGRHGSPPRAGRPIPAGKTAAPTPPGRQPTRTAGTAPCRAGTGGGTTANRAVPPSARGASKKRPQSSSTVGRPDTTELAELLERTRPTSVTPIIGREVSAQHEAPQTNLGERPPGLVGRWRPQPGASADCAEQQPKADPRGLTRFKNGIVTTRLGLAQDKLPATMRQQILSRMAEQERSWTRSPSPTTTDAPSVGVIRGAREPLPTPADAPPAAGIVREPQPTATNDLLTGIDLTGGRSIITGTRKPEEKQ